MSAKNNREIEIKLEVTGLDLEEANQLISKLLGPKVKRKTYGKSTDMYWPVHGSNGQGFVRTRKLDEDTNCLTVKVKDKGSNINRKEVDIYTTDSHSKLVAFCKALAGPAQGSVEKEYYVYWPTLEELPNISVYEITNHPGNRVFIEIEAATEEELTILEKNLLNSAYSCCTISRASGSLYEMFIMPQENTVKEKKDE